jgi:hypothetical protein
MVLPRAEPGVPPFMRDRAKAAVAGCRQDGVRVEWFFPEERHERPAFDALAKRICRTCPLRWECRDWAMTNREGIRHVGATTEQERRCLLRMCGHGRCRTKPFTEGTR